MSRFALSVLFVCSIVRAFAQSEVGSASLAGAVTDPSGAAIAGATVHLTSDATGFTRATVTNESGVYSFVRVPVGIYSLSVEHPGFRTTRNAGIKLQVGAVIAYDVQLQVGAAHEVISVTADVPLVETTRSQSSTVVNEKSVADLPVNGRNFLDFTRLTPGVVSDPTRGGDLSFGGQRGPANSLLVDGGDSNNVFFGQATGRTGFRPYAFSQDAVQEFQVNANGAPAEVGRAGGGVINVITKSGTNDFHGSVFEFYRDKALNANTFTNNRAGTRKQPYHFNQFGGSLGGPILRDKLFFFGNYDGQRNTIPQPVVPNIFPTGEALTQLQQYLAPYTIGVDNAVYLAKVDWNVSDRQRVSVRYNGNRVTAKNSEANSLSSALEHTGNSRVTTDNVVGTYTGVLSDRFVYDARFVFIRDNEPGEANASTPETIITNGITFGRNNFSPRYTNARTWQTVQSFSYVAGRHTIKFGADINAVRIGNFFPGLFSGSYTFSNFADYLARRPAQFTQAFAGPGTSGPLTQPNVNEYAFFAQDSWRATDRLTLNYGIRYDRFNTISPRS